MTRQDFDKSYFTGSTIEDEKEACLEYIFELTQQIAKQEAQLNDYADEIYRLQDLRHRSVLITQDDVDFLQLQNQQYADLVSELLEPKSCSWCAYSEADSCTKLQFVLPHNPDSFSCSYHEPKDTK